jgi:5-(hydroxymethyl)furfural/furfural oxidase
MVYDYIVVGAGAAGCVIASRLTQRDDINVLLIEAGKDIPVGSEPADILDNYPTSYYNKSYTWPGLKASWKKRADGAGHFPQGKIMGGGGSIMGMVSLRGTPADYADWQTAGAKNWSWDDVLPYFRKLETDWNFQNQCHGQDGPIPIRRLPQDQWPPLSQAIAKYAQHQGISAIADMNSDFSDGLGSVPMCNSESRRASSALCYLTAQVRSRKNLRILANSQVKKILFEGTKAIGIELFEGHEKSYFAKEIIISSGGIFSPSLLMRSGIGNQQQLQDLKIPVINHRPGVGQNLQNHATLFLGFHLKQKSRQIKTLRTHPSISFRYSSNLPNCAPGDLYINIQSKTSWNAMGQQIGNLAPNLLRPKSVGQIELDPQNIFGHPLIEFNFLDHPQDLQRLKIAFIFAVKILLDPQVASCMGTPFPVRFTDRLRLLNEYTVKNARKANALSGLLALFPWASDLVLSRLTGDHVDLAKLIQDDQALDAHIRENVAGLFHPVGTCRMGLLEDPQAVVNEEGLVHGVEQLRVVDASIMPNLIAGNTNIPTIMVAEKIAATILEKI